MLRIYFQATLPCHQHSTLASQTREGLHQLWALPSYFRLPFFIYCKHYGFEWAFFTHRYVFLPLHSFPTFLAAHPWLFGITCFYQGFAGSRQLLLKVARLQGSSKHRTGPSICLIHSIPQSSTHLNFVFIHVNIAKVLLVVKILIRSAATLFSSH